MDCYPDTRVYSWETCGLLRILFCFWRKFALNEHEPHSIYSFCVSEIKVEVKTEEDPEPAIDQPQGNNDAEHQHDQDGAARAEQVKVEAEKGGNHSRKRPYEDNRSYSYYEHREEKRYTSHISGDLVFLDQHIGSIHQV